MIFNLLRMRNLKDHRGLSPIKKMLWYFIIFGSTSLAFYYNFNYRMAKIDAQSAFYDESGTITKQARQNVIDLVNLLKRDFSTQSRIQIMNEDVYIPKLKANELYLGVSVNKDQAILILPNLINKALTKEQKNSLDSQLMQCVVQKNQSLNLSNQVVAKINNQSILVTNSTQSIPENTMSFEPQVDYLAACLSVTLSSIITYLNE